MSSVICTLASVLTHSSLWPLCSSHGNLSLQPNSSNSRVLCARRRGDTYLVRWLKPEVNKGTIRMTNICAKFLGTINLSSPMSALPVALMRFSPFAVRGNSDVPVCRPFRDHSVSPWRITNARGVVIVLNAPQWFALTGWNPKTKLLLLPSDSLNGRSDFRRKDLQQVSARGTRGLVGLWWSFGLPFGLSIRRRSERLDGIRN